MHLTKQSLSPTKVKLEVKAEPDDLNPIHQAILKRFARSAKVPGFRAGKAPLQMVEKHIDQKLLADEFLNDAVNRLYGVAIEQERLRPVGRPDISLKSFVPFTQLVFTAELEAVGKIQVPDYTSLKLPLKKATITAAEINQVLESLRLRLADRQTVGRGAKTGDEVTIDFNGEDKDGKPVVGAAGKDYPLILGSKTFIPGFEDNLTGVKAGDKKSFEITFPADYPTITLRSQPVTFIVQVKTVAELVKPALDDKFAAKAGPFKTISELKKDIKTQSSRERQWQMDRDYESELIRLLTAKVKVEIPDVLIEEQLDKMELEEKNNLLKQGQTWQEHLTTEGINEQQHRDRHRPEALERVKAGLALSEIAETEKLEVTPEELEIRIQVLKGQYQDPQMQAELDKPENRRDLVNRLLTEKTISTLVKHASK